MATSDSTPFQLPLAIEEMIVEIPLTQGKVAIVDARDADLAAVKWYAQYDPTSGDYYAVRNIPKAGGGQTRELMHRVILSRALARPLLKGEQVDHIYRNTLDNRRSQLRVATNAQNIRNRGVGITNTSGYKGVSWKQSHQRWTAQINNNGKKIYLGLFDTPEAAYEAYCKAARELHGEFASL